MRLLIVDDSEAFVERLTLSLTKVPGVEVVGSAGNVADAILRIRQTKPDVVILDIGMPGGSGIDVLEGLKQDPFQPIVIVLSNHTHRQYRRKCQTYGVRFYFDKSTEYQMVAAVLRGLMKKAAA